MFETKIWVNRESEHPTRRVLTPTGNENEYDVSRAEGVIIEDGDMFSAENMNDMESRIDNAITGVEESVAQRNTNIQAVSNALNSRQNISIRVEGTTAYITW